jgi:hypothetical protein
MEHEMVAREKFAEKYLLNELDSAARDEFEEHFFDCPECALDVHAGSLFVEQSKIVLAGKMELSQGGAARAPVPSTPGWFSRLRPPLTVPVLALLLVVIGYQNLVTYPQLKAAWNSPRVLPWTSVNVGTYGSDATTITTHPGEGFLLFVRIPPDAGYSRYAADLYNQAGKVEWSITIPASTTQDQWPVQVPGSNRKAGYYSLAVHGLTISGESKEIGRASFELRIQK